MQWIGLIELMQLMQSIISVPWTLLIWLTELIWSTWSINSASLWFNYNTIYTIDRIDWFYVIEMINTTIFIWDVWKMSFITSVHGLAVQHHAYHIQPVIHIQYFHCHVPSQLWTQEQAWVHHVVAVQVWCHQSVGLWVAMVYSMNDFFSASFTVALAARNLRAPCASHLHPVLYERTRVSDLSWILMLDMMPSYPEMTNSEAMWMRNIILPPRSWSRQPYGGVPLLDSCWLVCVSLINFEGGNPFW